MPDGVVGPLTAAELSAPAPPPIEPLPTAPLPTAPPIDRSLRLSSDRYFGDPRPKSLIVLHHTVGGSALSTFRWFQARPGHIATAYLVERDGTIFELFDPRLWAFHLGVAGTGGTLDRRSIGIELASEGALFGGPGELLAFGGPGVVRRFTGPAFDAGSPWRDHRWFAAYNEAQTEAAIELVDHLLATFGIPRRTPGDHGGRIHDLDFRGVVSHHHLRADKTDVHPGFPWSRLVERCALEVVVV
jgi:N-acetyl-anhydromuramyl-L-alanine amidase AmpD